MGAPKTWHKAFRELPASWRMLPYFKRSIMQDLWRLSSADCTGTFPVAGDPAQFLVRALDLGDRHERVKAVKAVRELIVAGLITVEGSVVTIRTTPTNTDSLPTQHHTDTNSAPQPPLLRCSVGSGTQANDTESFESGAVEREREENRESSLRARTPARETHDVAVPLRPPVQTRAPASVGADRLMRVTSRQFSPATKAHREQLHEIGLKPEAEWRIAAEVLRASAQRPGNVANMLTPEHVLANWHWYSQGQEPPTAASIAAERAKRTAQPQPAKTTAVATTYRYADAANGERYAAE